MKRKGKCLAIWKEDRDFCFRFSKKAEKKSFKKKLPLYKKILESDRWEEKYKEF